MIHLDFFRDVNERYFAFEMEGHADYADYGEDIVCAALTALATSCIGAMTDLLELDVNYVAGPGLITLEVLKLGTREPEMEAKIDLLFKSFELGARQVLESIEDGEEWIEMKTLEMSEEEYNAED